MKKRIAVITGFRSHMGKAGGLMKDVRAHQLGAAIAKETMIRSKLCPSLLDEVIIGNVAQPSDAANIARVIAVNAGVPYNVPAFTVHRNCASGMESFALSSLKILQGQAKIILCGGVESMSNIPLLFSKDLTTTFANLAKARTPLEKIKTILAIKLKSLKPRIGLLEGLTDPISGLIMGLTAENLATDFSINRDAQDNFALRSHKLATQAIVAKKFDEEIVSVFNYNDEDPQITTCDEGVRQNQSIEDLAKLKPYFNKNSGTVTVGNSSQITDGAAMAILMSEEQARDLKITPLGFISDFAFAGLDPSRMGLGPVFATHKLLQQSKMTLKDFDLFEINEAFASQVLACVKAFASNEFCQKHFEENAMGEIDIDTLNINGGAIALGHPVGMSGSRIILHSLYQLRAKQKYRALASLCIGGGQGGAMILEAY